MISSKNYSEKIISDTKAAVALVIEAFKKLKESIQNFANAISDIFHFPFWLYRDDQILRRFLVKANNQKWIVHKDYRVLWHRYKEAQICNRWYQQWNRRRKY